MGQLGRGWVLMGVLRHSKKKSEQQHPPSRFPWYIHTAKLYWRPLLFGSESIAQLVLSSQSLHAACIMIIQYSRCVHRLESLTAQQSTVHFIQSAQSHRHTRAQLCDVTRSNNRTAKVPRVCIPAWHIKFYKMGTVTAVTGLIIPKTNIGVRWPLIDVFALWLTPTESTPLKNTEEGRGGLGGTQVIIKEEELHVLLRS